MTPSRQEQKPNVAAIKPTGQQHWFCLSGGRSRGSASLRRTHLPCLLSRLGGPFFPLPVARQTTIRRTWKLKSFVNAWKTMTSRTPTQPPVDSMVFSVHWISGASQRSSSKNYKFELSLSSCSNLVFRGHRWSGVLSSSNSQPKGNAVAV